MRLSVPPNTNVSSITKGDVLIQILCPDSLSQWFVLDVKGTDRYHLQLISKEGTFTNKMKVVRGKEISQYIKDGLATRLLKSIRSKRKSN